VTKYQTVLGSKENKQKNYEIIRTIRLLDMGKKFPMLHLSL
jgi:hypothetical protein